MCLSKNICIHDITRACLSPARLATRSLNNRTGKFMGEDLKPHRTYFFIFLKNVKIGENFKARLRRGWKFSLSEGEKCRNSQRPSTLLLLAKTGCSGKVLEVAITTFFNFLWWAFYELVEIIKLWITRSFDANDNFYSSFLRWKKLHFCGADAITS